ncbi:DUF1508 domain-containing protein [Streptomyces sp. So13.3]|uniref:YegP family protein n=1 Tax=Streptomyces TaxID=1883 RepID=UPI00164E9C56|nr:MULTISPECIES: DUF1508 domain-containing protein [Streptomyces]MCZ4103568.1 DUF1508 domain-containing protein [Streptomyces sp. H39-C1]QNA77539.1 DUF1508 domain-containing protein [Streptomyces sp. So13.3]
MTGGFEIYQDSAELWRFRYRTDLGEIIAVSDEGLNKQSSIRNVIDYIQRNAAQAPIQDVTDNTAGPEQ